MSDRVGGRKETTLSLIEYANNVLQHVQGQY